jgi:hypothetical protein
MFTSRNKTEAAPTPERFLAFAGEYHRGCLGRGNEFHIPLTRADQLKVQRQTIGRETCGDTY